LWPPAAAAAASDVCASTIAYFALRTSVVGVGGAVEGALAAFLGLEIVEGQVARRAHGRLPPLAACVPATQLCLLVRLASPVVA
jgi:shikimate 5-dehydrogenase